MKPHIPVSMVPAAGNTAAVVVVIVLGITAIVIRHVLKRPQPDDSQAAGLRSGY